MDQPPRNDASNPMQQRQADLQHLLKQARDMADQMEYHLCAAFIDQAVTALSEIKPFSL